MLAKKRRIWMWKLELYVDKASEVFIAINILAAIETSYCICQLGTIYGKDKDDTGNRE